MKGIENQILNRQRGLHEKKNLVSLQNLCTFAFDLRVINPMAS